MEHLESRELRISRTFSVPVDLMWKVWTSPEHILHWWGPNGFTTTIHKMDLKEGGEWKLTLHGPDGTNYPNRSIYKEIDPHKKIVFEHFNPHFIASIIFEAKRKETRIDWSMLFDTNEMRETVVKVHKADEGQKQNLERLENYLSEIKENHKPGIAR